MVSQPTISKAIAQLESQLGVKLFDRVNQRVLLTAAGDLLAGATKDLLERSQGFRVDLDQLTGGPPRGTVRLAVLRTMGVAMVPELVAAVRAKFPQLNLAITFAAPDEIELQLCEGSADIGILPGPGSLGLAVRELGPDQAVLVAGCGCDLPDSLMIDALAQLPMILAGPTNPWWTEHLAPFFLGSGIEPTICMTVDQGEATMALVERDLGASILPGHLVWTSIQSGRMKRIAVMGGLFSQDLICATLQGRRLSRATAAVLDLALVTLPTVLGV